MTQTTSLPSHVAKFIEDQMPQLSSAVKRISEINSTEDLINIDVRLRGAAQAVRIMRGCIYKRWQEISDAKSFTQYLVQAQIPRRTAYDYIDEANAYERAGSIEGCERLALLPATKVRTLKVLNDDELSAFVSGEQVKGITIDEAAAMDRDEFAHVITSNELLEEKDAEIESLKQQVAESGLMLQDAKMELDHERKKRADGLPETEFPAFYTELRHESAVLSENAIITLDQLHALLIKGQEQVLDNARMGIEDDKYIRMAAQTLFHHARGVAAHAHCLLKLMKTWDIADEEDISADLFMTDAEAFEFVSNRELLVQQHRHEAIMREQERERNQKPKRGRPAKQKQ